MFGRISLQSKKSYLLANSTRRLPACTYEESKAFPFTVKDPVYSGSNGLLRRLINKVKLIENRVSLKISDILK